MPSDPQALDVPGALWRHRILILILVVVGALAGFIASGTTDAVYTAAAKVWVKPTAINPPGSVPLPATISMPTEAELARSTSVASAAANQAAEGSDGSSLASRTQATFEPDSFVLTIAVTAPTPEGARDDATAMADAYLDFRATQAADQAANAIEHAQEQLTGLRVRLKEASAKQADAPDGSPAAIEAQNAVAQLNGQIAIWENAVSLLNVSGVDPGSVIAPATVPASPSSPDRLQDVARAALAGLLVGVVVALLLEGRRSARARSAA